MVLSADVKRSLNKSIGSTLGKAPGIVCMQTKCQDILPKALAGPCKQPATGREARKACKHFLANCQQDEEARQACRHKCSRYFQHSKLDTCVRDCNIARCRSYPPYDDCVALHMFQNILACFQQTSARQQAESCLRERCHIHPSSAPFLPEQTLD